MNKTYVISVKEFESIGDSENKINGRFQSSDQQVAPKMHLYRVVEKYSIRLKFVKQKGSL